LYGEFLDERPVIQARLTWFIGELESQDLPRIAKARSEFGSFLDSLEQAGQD
jgi:hypothetical protein